MVGVQNPVRLSQHSEPQPDFSLLAPRADRYRRATPTPSEVLLLIEVADTSGRYDRTVKLPLYARHGIPEVWIVDLRANEIEVRREPGSNGYAVCERFGAGNAHLADLAAGGAAARRRDPRLSSCPPLNGLETTVETDQ